MSSLYDALIGRFVRRWYLDPLAGQMEQLSPTQQQSLRRQAVIGWLQTVLLVIVVVQTIFAGLLRALPPDVRASLGFLHRIEWGAYVGIVLILLQDVVGWRERIVLTNRFRMLAWLLSRPRLLTGDSARRLQVVYLIVAILMIGAVLWVRANGFIVTPTR
jgi:hypothetical protein